MRDVVVANHELKVMGETLSKGTNIKDAETSDILYSCVYRINALDKCKRMKWNIVEEIQE